jgi:hypothetical protein
MNRSSAPFFCFLPFMFYLDGLLSCLPWENPLYKSGCFYYVNHRVHIAICVHSLTHVTITIRWANVHKSQGASMAVIVEEPTPTCAKSSSLQFLQIFMFFYCLYVISGSKVGASSYSVASKIFPLVPSIPLTCYR